MDSIQQRQEKYHQVLREEKTLTAAWYAKMSGETPWKDPGEKERILRRFEEFSVRITNLQAEGAR
jgi:hypothetical protein